MVEQNFDRSNENNVEFLNGQHKITFTFTSRKFVNRMKKYKESHPNDVDFVENIDGSICGHVPLKWLKISPPRKVSDDQRVAMSERMKIMQGKKQNDM